MNFTSIFREVREGGQVKHEFVGYLSDLQDDRGNVIMDWLATGKALFGDEGIMSIGRSLPHGKLVEVPSPTRIHDHDQAYRRRSA